MDPALQIEPERCVLVLGSQLAAAALALPEGVPAALSYAMVVEIGMQKMLEVEGVDDMEEKARKQSLMLSAYELEPAFAASKVVETMRDHGIYQQWLEELFGSLLALPTHRNEGGIVSQLHALQEKGVLLVYTYYDTILDLALNTTPVLLSDEEATRSWAARKTPGLLHVHGVYSQPDSMCCDCVNYRRLVGGACGGQVLKEVCRNRSVIFLGFDGEFFDPFLFKFSRTFLGPSYTPPLLLSLAPKLPSLDVFLTLKIPQLLDLEKIFISSSPVPRLGTRDAMENKINTTLLYINKNCCLDAAERVKVTSGINVHQLTMRHEHLYHHLILYQDREGLKELWKILFQTVSSQDTGGLPRLQNGLLGIMLDKMVVWLSRAAAMGKGGVSPLPSPMETLQQGLHIGSTLSSLHHQPRTVGHTPSLTTSVSVIGSMWTPIASPSASKSNSTYTRPPTLPSPLISSTSRTSLGGVATKGPRPLGNTLSPHTQVRKVKSEKDHLTYQDRLAQQARKNGLLLHTESAPDFVEAQLARMRAGSGTGNQPRPSLLPRSDIDQQQQQHVEVKIERVDQLRGTAGSKATPTDLRNLSVELRKSSPALSPRAFAEERKKFISEAQSWSKHVDMEIAKKKNEVEPNPLEAGGVAGGGGLSLGFFASRATGQPSLSSKFSQEEQEKLLRQHFEQIQQQQLQLTSRLTPSPTPPQLPHLSVSTHSHPGHPHSSHPSSSKPSSHQPGGGPSPSKSPLNPYHTSSTASAAIFPFLNQTANLHNPASFMCNPSLSQYPATFLNPLYHAAMQQLLSSQVKGAPPMLASDPSILQSLVDKVPIFLPDGSITFIPTSSALQGAGAGAGTVPGENTAGQDGGGPNNHKRTRSPDTDARMEYFRGSPPKRRRSSSLPDITQIPLAALKEGIKEEEEDVGVVRRIPVMSTEEPHHHHHRQLAPPTMIHIPQDMKMGDPMMGFPTPPQSSPLVGNFALSPIVLSSSPFQGHQPMTPVTPNQDAFGAEELRELVESSGQTPLPPSPEGSNLPPFPAGRGPIQLWQFLLDLLLSPDKKHMIDWTGNGYEFRILQPEDIAKLWGARKNKPRMNYDKLSRGLRYYYSKGIMDKVQGKKLTFKYTCDVQNYVRTRQNQNSTAPPIGTAGGGGGGGGGKYRSGSDSSVSLSNNGRGDEVQEEGVASQDRAERSFSDLELMSGFHSIAATAAANKTGEVVSVVSQGFGALQGSGVDSDNSASSANNGICSEAI